MATTFSATYFKNIVLGYISGVTAYSANNKLYYGNLYNGVQPANPEATPAGSAVWASYSAGISITPMSAAGGGISQLGVSATKNATNSIASLTFMRIYNLSGNPAVDVPVSLVGGGGGAILDSLSTTAGVAIALTTFSIKWPKNNGGTLYLSQSLVNRIVDNLTASSSVVPDFGINSSGSSVINVYSGAAPADADATPTGTLLCTFTIGASQVFTTPSGGSSALTGTLTSAAAGNSGTAGYARWVKTNGSSTFTIQGSIGTTGTDFIINTTTIVSGNTYTISDATLTI